MFNIDHSAAALRNADTILSSDLLTDAERITMLEGLLSSLPAKIAQPHTQAARTAITRKLGELHGKDRTTPRVQEQAEVAEGSGSSEAEASEGSTEGVEEQAEDGGGFRSGHPKRRRRKASGAAGKT